MRLNFFMTDHAITRFRQRIDPTLTIPQMKRRVRKAQELSHKERKIMAKQRPWRAGELRNNGDPDLLLLTDKQAIYLLRQVEAGSYNVVTIFSRDMIQQGSYYGEETRQAIKRRKLNKAKPTRSGNHQRTNRERRSYARGMAAEASRSPEPKPR